MNHLSSVPDWVILQIDACKKVETNQPSKYLYFELCTLDGSKVGSAISIPVESAKGADEFKTVILSKNSAKEVVQTLLKAGISMGQP